nr:hypothetical protein [Tanacetum cinerariifolium]
PCAWQATGIPRSRAVSTTARISSSEYCGPLPLGLRSSTPPVLAILMRSAPRLNCSRTACRHWSGPLATLLGWPSFSIISALRPSPSSMCPPVAEIAVPAEKMRGPGTRPRFTALRRAVFTPEPPHRPAPPQCGPYLPPGFAGLGGGRCARRAGARSAGRFFGRKPLGQRALGW